jgi:hypothetical protein
MTPGMSSGMGMNMGMNMGMGMNPSASNRGMNNPSYSGSAGYGASGYSPDYANRENVPEEASIAKDDKHDIQVILTASGVPTEGKKIEWPVGLRIVDTEDRGGLRRQLDSLLEVVARQAGTGEIQPRLVKEANRTIDRLDGELHHYEDRGSIPAAVAGESEQFLKKLKHALKVMQ